MAWICVKALSCTAILIVSMRNTQKAFTVPRKTEQDRGLHPRPESPETAQGTPITLEPLCVIRV